MRVLIAEDDPSSAAVLGRLLGPLATETETARPDRALPEKVLSWAPDLLIVELALKGSVPSGTDAAPLAEGGAGLLSAVRAVWPLGAVLVLGERPSPALRARWLEYGADDCLGKPFSLGELRARCGALLRRQATLRALPAAGRSSQPAPATLAVGALLLDRVRRQAECEGVVVRLTDREATLLEQLMLASGTVMSRTQLRKGLDTGAMAQAEGGLGGNVVDAHISAVRRKLRVCPAAPAIETVRGAGYRMLRQEESTAPEERRDGYRSR